MADTAPAQETKSTAENLAETVLPASRFCSAAAPDGDIGNETGEPRAPMEPVRELPTMQETALIGPLVPNALLPRRTG
jgi:hypothetical protein